MRVFLYECKKILCARVNIISLLLFTILLLGMFIGFVQEEKGYEMQNTYYDHGIKLSEKEVWDEVAVAKEEWTGDMDTSWWERLSEEYRLALKRMDAHFIDMERMDVLYGEGWYEDYKENQNEYAFLEDEDKEGKRLVYEQSMPLPFTKEEIRDSVIVSLHMNYGKTMMVKQPWNSEDGTFGEMYSGFNNEKVAAPVYGKGNLEQSEILFLKEYMNQKGTFHYGDSKRWYTFLQVLSTAGTLLLVWVLLISSNLINKERKHGMLEALSSCTKGRATLLFSKIAAVFICGCIGYLVMCGGLLLYAWISGNLGDMNVNITEQSIFVSIFTYGEAFFISIGAQLLGVLAVSIIGCTISTLIKSSYASFAVTIAVLFLPKMLDTRLTIFMPSEFMTIDNIAVRGFSVPIGSQVYLVWKLLPVVWMPLLIVLIGITAFVYLNRRYPRTE